MKRIIDISDDTFNILKNMIEADCVDPYSLADIIVNESIPYEEKPQGECKYCKYRDPEDKKCDCGAMERQGCIFPVSDNYYCKYYEPDQNDFVSGPTEVVKVGEPLPNSDEINKALEKGWKAYCEGQKEGFKKAEYIFERMKLVQETVDCIRYTFKQDTESDKLVRNCMALVQNAIDGEYHDMEEIDVSKLEKPQGEWIRLDLAKRVIAKFKGYLDEDMIERIQIALEKENFDIPLKQED